MLKPTVYFRTALRRTTTISLYSTDTLVFAVETQCVFTVGEKFNLHIRDKRYDSKSRISSCENSINA